MEKTTPLLVANPCFYNTTGDANSAFGTIALVQNTSGSFNTAMGESSLGQNRTGSYNTALGYSALGNNTTGEFNTAVGTKALNSNTTGNSNVAVGRYFLAGTTSRLGIMLCTIIPGQGKVAKAIQHTKHQQLVIATTTRVTKSQQTIFKYNRSR